MTYLGKSIVDKNPEEYNKRWDSNQDWRCSKDVEIPAGWFAIKISNWRHQGENTPVPVFDVALDIKFQFTIGISVGYKDAEGHWSTRATGSLVDLGRDKIFVQNLGGTNAEGGVWYQTTTPIKVYLGNIQNFAGPFFFHVFSGPPADSIPLSSLHTPGEPRPLSEEFSW